MTCRRAILAARRHAELVDQVEACAPPVSAPYLTAAIERCRLPISVSMIDDRFGLRFDICVTDLSSFAETDIAREVTASPRSASVAYFDLVSHFNSSPTPPRSPREGEDAAGDSPITSGPLSSATLPTILPVVAETSPDVTADLAASGVLSSREAAQ